MQMWCCLLAPVCCHFGGKCIRPRTFKLNSLHLSVDKWIVKITCPNRLLSCRQYTIWWGSRIAPNLVQEKYCLSLLSWWRHQMETFSALLAICAGNSQHKGQWHRALMFSLICAWLNVWVKYGETGDLRCHRAHCDITVMIARDLLDIIISLCWRHPRPWWLNKQIATQTWLI